MKHLNARKCLKNIIKNALDVDYRINCLHSWKGQIESCVWSMCDLYVVLELEGEGSEKESETDKALVCDE